MNLKDFSNNNKSGSHTLLLVSLYLAILAFFILLNTLSEKDNKKSALTIGSLVNTFSKDSGYINFKPLSPSAINFDQLIANYYGEIKSQIGSIFGTDSNNVKMEGNKIYYNFLADDFFKQDSIDIRQTKEKFINFLSEIANRETHTVNIDFEFLIASPHYLTFGKDKEYNLDIKRTGKIAKELTSKGIDPKNIYVGIKSDRKRTIDIYIYISPQLEEKVD